MDRGLVTGVFGSQRIWRGESWRGQCARREYPNSVNEISIHFRLIVKLHMHSIDPKQHSKIL